MLLYKRNKLIFLSIILLLVQKTNNKSDSSNNEINLKNSMKPFDKPDDPKHDEFREKGIILKAENNNLQIQIEVYNIYLYFLVSLNIIFIVLIISYILYKICFDSRDINLIKELEKDIALKIMDSKNNKFNNIIYKESIIDNNYENSHNEELLNNSGLEAPPIRMN